MNDFLSIDDLDPDQLGAILDAAAKVKKKPASWANRLQGKQIAMVFEKPSTRTRVSFEAAVSTMGGHAIVLRDDELQLGRGETVEDTGRVLSRYVDAIVVRTFGQDRLERLGAAASVPVVNALSDFEHPCQALADLLTIREQRGELKGVSIGYVGDGNNVAHSLMLAGAKLGMDVRVATPPGHEPFPQVTDRSKELAARTDGKVAVTNVVSEAVIGASIVYTDVWASMGQESSADERKEVFAKYQVNSDLVEMASQDALVMHCLPAHRGEEISTDVLDGPRSIVWDQAENRLHTQKALLDHLLA
jgi:ornithine carbamoyltransferase